MLGGRVLSAAEEERKRGQGRVIIHHHPAVAPTVQAVQPAAKVVIPNRVAVTEIVPVANPVELVRRIAGPAAAMAPVKQAREKHAPPVLQIAAIVAGMVYVKEAWVKLALIVLPIAEVARCVIMTALVKGATEKIVRIVLVIVGFAVDAIMTELVSRQTGKPAMRAPIAVRVFPAATLLVMEARIVRRAQGIVDRVRSGVLMVHAAEEKPVRLVRKIVDVVQLMEGGAIGAPGGRVLQAVVEGHNPGQGRVTIQHLLAVDQIVPALIQKASHATLRPVRQVVGLMDVRLI